MIWRWVLFGFLLLILAFVLVISYICYRITFYAPRRKPSGESIQLPVGQIYDPYRESMENWTKELRQMPHLALEIALQAYFAADAAAYRRGLQKVFRHQLEERAPLAVVG